MSSSLLVGAWVALIFWVLGQMWFVQLVIYPLFARVGELEYVGYHRFYTQRIPLPVIVPGFASFIAPIALGWFGPAVPSWMTAANVLAGLGSGVVTIALQIPRHNRLERARDASVIQELVRYNWLRTFCVTVQALVTFVMILRFFGGA
jgi:hypothetical protein